jgi:hypothetical protein
MLYGITMNNTEWKKTMVDSLTRYVSKWHEGDLDVSHPSDISHDHSNWSWEDTDDLIFLVESLLTFINNDDRLEAQ